MLHCGIAPSDNAGCMSRGMHLLNQRKDNDKIGIFARLQKLQL